MKRKITYSFKKLDETVAKQICKALKNALFAFNISERDTRWIVTKLSRWELMLGMDNEEHIAAAIEEMNDNADRIIRLLKRAKIIN